MLFCEGQTAALRLLALSLAASWAAGETQLVQRADEGRPQVGIRGFELAQ